MNFEKNKLKQYIERIERLEEEKKEVSIQINSIYADAKSEGFDTKVMRKIIKIRSMKAHEVREEEMLLETYLNALNSAEN